MHDDLKAVYDDFCSAMSDAHEHDAICSNAKLKAFVSAPLDKSSVETHGITDYSISGYHWWWYLHYL